jgi:RHS repeat-associated protein
MRSLRLVLVLFATLLFVLPTSAQLAPICDSAGVCGPNPSDTSYPGLLTARPMRQNARGARNPLTPLARSSSSDIVPKVIGSQSYNWAIPIVTLPGRGLPLNLTLYYNSRVWTVDAVNGTVSFNLDRDFPSPGFRLDFGFLELDSTNHQYVLTEADASKHVLTLSTTGIYDSNDGTFIEYNSQTRALIYKNGATVFYEPFPSQATLFRPIKIRDTYGNYISISYVAGSGNDQHIDVVTDTLGRPFQFHYDAVSHQLQEIDQLNTSRTAVLRVWATFTWGNPALNYKFSLSVDGTTTTGNPMPALIGCRYPNNTGYNFTYGDWGIIDRIDSVSAPDTNSVQHIRSYETYNFPDASQALSDAPRYTTKTVSRDGTTNAGSVSAWNFSVLEPSLGNVTQETITDQLGTVTTFNLNGDGTLSSTTLNDSSGKTLKNTTMTWTRVGTSPMVAGVTTADDGGNAGSVSLTYDGNGNITDAKESDFNNALMRETITTYLAPSAHILDRPTTVKVLDGAGVVRSRTDYGYDTTTVTGIAGLVQNDGSNSGKLTQISSYSDPATPAGQNYVQLFYDQGGNVIKQQPNCCPPGGSIQPNAASLTIFNFDPGTQYAYLSSITKGGQYTTTFSFSPDTGLLQWSKDLNGQQTLYQYDNMFRLTSVTSPPSNGQTVQQIISYADDLQSPQVNTTSTVNSAKIVQTFDGLGHLTQQDTIDTSGASSPATVSTTQFQYDAIWRRIKTSNPFAGAEAVLWNTTAYDALDRVTSVTPPSGGGTTFTYAGNTVFVNDPAGKQRKNFFDALGRLTRVDEPGWGDALKAFDAATISGGERSKLITTQVCVQYDLHGHCLDWETDSSTVYDTGTVTLTVSNPNISYNASYSYNYGASDTSSTVAANLAQKVDADPGRIVNASNDPNTSVINFSASTAGVSGNSITVSKSSATTDAGDFGAGTTSFPITTSTPTLTGGEDAVSQANAVLTATRHLTTTYGYDVLNHLISVSQGQIGPINTETLSGQPRTFNYDGMGRLTSFTTPEAGTVNNYYTVNQTSCSGDSNAICQTTDARGITATFTYSDPLNRLTGISYSDGTPPVTFSYDAGGQAAFALGRLTNITEDVAGATNPNARTFTYDSRGRTASVTNTIAGQNYLVQHGYNSADQTTSLIYPSGRIVNFGYDKIGRLISIADSTNTGNPYLTINSSDYNSAGLAKKLTYGNGVISGLNYNDHLQISNVSYATPAAPPATPDILNLAYDFGASNNGQIQTIHYYNSAGVEDTTKSVSYSYDPWFRLLQAQTVNQTSSSSWMLQWSYDRFGNRMTQGGTGNAIVSQPQLTFDAATNHITGFCYDNAGNLTDETACPASGSPHRYTYDASNRLTSVNNGSAVATYTYFGPFRISKSAGTTNTVYVYSSGAPLAEYAPGALPNNPSREYIYGGLGMLASISNGTTTYFHPDHLSNRAETNAAGAISRTLGTFPFGDSWYDSNPVEKWKFTTYERDTAAGETGLDYATARSYESGLARFTSPDPYLGSMDLRNPQSLNRYAYVVNNPVNLMDPTGLDPTGGPYYDSTCTLFDGTQGEVFACGGAGGGQFGGFSFGLLGLGFGGLGGGFGIPLPGCILPGACNVQLPSLAQEINNWLAHMPWNDPCIMSPVNDLCGFTNFAPATQDYDTYNCLPPGVAGPPTAGCLAMQQEGMDSGAMGYQGYLGQRFVGQLVSKFFNYPRKLICTDSPTGAVKEGILGGAGKGVIAGGIEGAKDGAIDGTAAGPEGAAIGALTGAAVGGTAGYFSGSATAMVCNWLHAYGN